MNDIVNSLGSPVWWFSAVLVGFMINLVSAYAKPYIDTLMSRVSSVWRSRTESAELEFRATVEVLVRSPQAMINAKEDEVRARLSVIFGLLIAIVFFLSSIALKIDASIPATNERFTEYWYMRVAIKTLVLLALIAVLMTQREVIRLSALVRAARRVQILQGFSEIQANLSDRSGIANHASSEESVPDVR